MKNKNVCLDTNAIISYLLISEPQHKIIKDFLSNHNNHYFYTENIEKECEKVFLEKYNFIRSIILDFNKHLDLYHNNVLSVNEYINQFIKKNKKTYTFKGKTYEKKEIKHILNIMWFNTSIEENIEGFELQNHISNYLWKLSTELWAFKEDFFNKLIFIQAHQHNYPEIMNKLSDNNSHYEDNIIILDLYEYHLNNNIKFIILSFDNNFSKALKICNFNFIENILSWKELNELT